MLLGQQYTQRSDMYSLGLVLWEVVSAARTVKYTSSSSDRLTTRTRPGLSQFMVRTRSSNSPSSSSSAAASSSVASHHHHHHSSTSPGVSQDAAVEIAPTVSYGAVPYAECKSQIGMRKKEGERRNSSSSSSSSSSSGGGGGGVM